MFRSRDRLLEHVVLERFVVTLKPGCGPMFKALLAEVDSRVLRFVDVAVLESSVERPAQGELYVERINVAYMQRVATAEKE